jgi:PAS domain S-box-containing protein
LVHPDDRDATAEEVARVAAGIHMVEFENRLRCKDGSYRSLAWNAAPDISGRRMFALGRDVTRHRRVEAARQAAETQAQAVLDTAIDGIIVIDEKGTIKTFNAAAEGIFGYRAAEVVGGNVRRIVPEPHRSRHDDYLERYQRTGEARIIGIGREVEGLRSDGSRVPLELAISEMRIAGKRYFTGITRDITDRRMMEQVKREFLSTVSHELRTPMTSVLGSLRLLAGGIAGELPAKAQKLARIATTNSERLIRLINDLLDLDKIEAGKLELRIDATDPAQLISRAVEEMAPYARDHGVRLEAELAELPQLSIDEDRMVQVLVNLLSNAIKFSPDGGVVTVRGRVATDGMILLEVVDQGPGIEPDDQPLVFGKFKQLDGSDSRGQGGTGLGLAICKAIVEQHGGRIDVDSEPGRGSTFWLALAAERAETEPGS